MKEQIIEIITSLKKKHPNDPTQNQDFEKIVSILANSEKSTIALLSELDEDSISWIAPLFEDISYKLKSQAFIECITNLSIKYPSIPYIKDDVKDAKEIIE